MNVHSTCKAISLFVNSLEIPVYIKTHEWTSEKWAVAELSTVNPSCWDAWPSEPLRAFSSEMTVWNLWLLNNWESAVRMGLGCVTAYYLKRYFWAASGESPLMAWVAPTACEALTEGVERCSAQLHRSFFFFFPLPLLIHSLKSCLISRLGCMNTLHFHTVPSSIRLLFLFFFFVYTRVRFLLGGRHGDFKFLPPSSYAPCYEALLPKEKMKVEPVKEYKRDVDGVRDLLGTAHFLSQASFIPTPVETSQVNWDMSIISALLEPFEWNTCKYL